MHSPGIPEASGCLVADTEEAVEVLLGAKVGRMQDMDKNSEKDEEGTGSSKSAAELIRGEGWSQEWCEVCCPQAMAIGVFFLQKCCLRNVIPHETQAKARVFSLEMQQCLVKSTCQFGY